MNAFNILPIVIGAGALVALVLIGMMMTRFYKRATRQVALIRTGQGGMKVVMDGGVFCIPVLHELMRINMETLVIVVSRENEEALITLDKMRVDTKAEFFLRVAPDKESIANAAQTLGNRTFDRNALREQIEGKVVDTLRAVAATMNLNDLHENRSDFIQRVQQSLAGELKPNGLVLESVALTHLDQTNFAKLSDNNVFNAVAKRQLAEIVTAQARERARIEEEGAIAIRETQRNAAIRRMEIEQEEREAAATQAIKLAEIQAEEEAAQAQRREQANQARETAEIERRRAIELAEQQRQIAVQRASEEQSKAEADANTARAEAVKSEEGVKTARQLAEAERVKQIAVLQASQDAERDATQMRIRAIAERDAAEARAQAIEVETRAEAARIKTLAEAELAKGTAEAEARQKMVEAENGMSPAIITLKTTMARIEVMPDVIREMMKPVEKLDSFKAIHISGLGGNGTIGANGQENTGKGGPVNDIQTLMRNMALEHPVLKRLGQEAGFALDNGLEGILNGDTDTLDDNAKKG